MIKLVNRANGTTGVITWYNKKLDEYRVHFTDKSEDYLKIDGVDVIFDDV